MSDKSHHSMMLRVIQRCLLAGVFPSAIILLLTGFVLLDRLGVPFDVTWVWGSLVAFVIMMISLVLAFFELLRGHVILETRDERISSTQYSRMISLTQWYFLSGLCALMAMVVLMTSQWGG